MKIEINTLEKTIKILEDVSVKDIMELGASIKNFDEYKIIQSKEFIYTQPIQYIYHQNPYIPITPYTPIWTTSIGTGRTDVTITTTGSSYTNSYYNHNLD